MERRKISYADYMMLGNIKKPSLAECLFCKHYLEHYPETKNGIVRTLESYAFVRQMRLWAYVLLFIPAHVLEFFHCLWDGGLREFAPFIYKNMISRYQFYATDRDIAPSTFNKCEEMWNKGQ